MKEFKVDLEVITPMFLHGADGIKAEIRAPSIKGMMRYWWRAAKAEDNIQKLKKCEDNIFGSTEGKAKVYIKLLLKKSIKRNDLSFNQNQIGLNYLFPPIFIGKVKGGIPKEYFDVGTKFSIILSAYDHDEEQLIQAIASLWLMIYLGGLGSRSRRGGGNLAVENTEGKGIPDINFKINSAENLKNWLEKNYSKVRKIINPSGVTQKYSNLHGAKLKIVDDEKNSWQDALEKLGEIYKEHRREYDLIDRAAMGLPIKNLDIYLGKEKQSEIRSGSRLILKVLKVNNIYYPLVIRLQGPILPESYKAGFRGREKNLPGDAIIEKFLSKLEEAQEVNL